jgi:hypothetical protein
MNPEQFNRIILTPALSLLPERMASVPARAMLIAICLQESGLIHRQQIGGPARGFPQFEKAGILGVLTHHATADLARHVCSELAYQPNVDEVHAAIRDNDLLAACFARLLLWTVPAALPGPDQPDVGWDQYTRAWRPGRPRRELWDDNWERARQAVGRIARHEGGQ